MSDKIVAQGSIRSSCKEKSASGPGSNLMEAQLKATHRLTMDFGSPLRLSRFTPKVSKTEKKVHFTNL